MKCCWPWTGRPLPPPCISPDPPVSLTSPGGEPWAMALGNIWGRTTKCEVTQAVTGVGKGGWKLGLESCPKLHLPLMSRKSSAMTTGPLSMGLPEPLKTRPGGV